MGNKVVIDADYFRHATDFEPNTTVFETILEDLDMKVIAYMKVWEK